MEEYPMEVIGLRDVVKSFRNGEPIAATTRVMPTTRVNARFHHISIVIDALAWIDREERRQLELRGLTITGRRFRASVDYAHPDQSGIVLDPDD